MSIQLSVRAEVLQEQPMNARPNVQEVRHVGPYAPDPAALAEFYRKTLGLQIVGVSGL